MLPQNPGCRPRFDFAAAETGRHFLMSVVVLILALALAGAFSAAIAGEATTTMQVRVYIHSAEDFQALLDLHPDIVWRDTAFLEVFTDLSGLSEIQTRGLITEIIHEDVVAFCRSRLLAEGKGMGAYRDLDEINAKIDSIVAANPAIVSPKISIGQTLQGRDLWAFKISDNPTVDEAEPEVLYTACIHAREVITPEVLFYFIDYLLANYGSSSRVNNIVDNRELWFVPMVNPDGYYYNQVDEPGGGGMWRKNRRPNVGGSYGVDLNRNFGYMWGCDNSGSSPTPSEATYRGTGPFSELETQALRDFTMAHEFVFSLYYHSYSNLILWPWGYKEAYTPDNHIFEAMGWDISYYNYYYPTPGWGLYLTNGGSDDWHYGEQTTKEKDYAFTIEVGDYWDNFWPPAYRIPALIQENLEPNLYLAEKADNPFYSDDAGNGLGACYSPQPLVVAPGDDTTVIIIMRNDGQYSYDNPFSTSVSYQNGSGWITRTPSSGIIPYGSSNTAQLSLQISAPAGATDFSLWKATLYIYSSCVSSPRTIPICLEVASDMAIPRYAELATACKRIRVYNNGGLAGNGPDAALDFIDECDTFNVSTDPTIYLYDAAPVICRLGTGGDTLRFTMYGKMTSATDALRPTAYLEVDSTSYVNFTYASASYKTADNAIGLQAKYYVPKTAPDCDFIAVTQELKNLTGDTLRDVLAGVFLDWNIPSDSGAMNGSGFYLDTTISSIHDPNDDTAFFATIYQFGAEFYDSLMGDCNQYSDQRFGGIIGDPKTLFRNAQILRTAEYVDTAGLYGQQAPLPKGPIYRIMKDNSGFDYYEPYDPDDYPNLATLVTFAEYDLPPNLTFSYTYILLTNRAGLSDYLARAEAADAWVAAQPQIRRHCLDKPGDANDDGRVNIGDGVYLTNYIFRPTAPPPPCMAEGDANADAMVNIGDAVFITNYVFIPGSPPPVPGPEK